MLKNRRSKIAIVAMMIFSMVAMYGALPTFEAEAASMTSAKATLSDSDLSASSTVVVQFKVNTTLWTNDYVRVSFESGTPGFTTLQYSNLQCGSEAGSDGNLTGSSTAIDVDDTGTDYLTCDVDGGADGFSGTSTITISGITNPGSEGDYTITVASYASTTPGTAIETTQMKAYILQSVTVQASVDASLSFSVSGLSQGEDINGTSTNAGITTTGTSIPFGTLAAGASTTIAGQRLSVSTNASYGYVVTVQQDGELRTGAGADINSFNNAPTGQGSTTAAAWAVPGGVVNDTKTYGHMGLISSDSDLFATNDYWAGLNGTDAMEVLSHTGPSGGYNAGSGVEGSEWANIAYGVQITALQEAGDYENELTYICTPTY